MVYIGYVYFSGLVDWLLATRDWQYPWNVRADSLQRAYTQSLSTPGMFPEIGATPFLLLSSSRLIPDFCQLSGISVEYHRNLKSTKKVIYSIFTKLVWRPVSIGALNFAYACSPCIVKGNNFFVCSRTPNWSWKQTFYSMLCILACN